MLSDALTDTNEAVELLRQLLVPESKIYVVCKGDHPDGTNKQYLVLIARDSEILNITAPVAFAIGAYWDMRCVLTAVSDNDIAEKLNYMVPDDGISLKLRLERV